MISAVYFLFTAYLPASISVILTTFFAIRYIDANQHIIASYIFSLPLITSIIIPPILAMAIKYIFNTIKTALILSSRILFLIVLVFISISLNSQYNLDLIYYGIALILLSVDQIISSNAPLIAKSKYKFTFSQSTAFSNILGRGFQAVAPFISVKLLNSSDSYIWNALIITLVIMSFLYPYYVFQFDKQEQSQVISNNVNPISVKPGLDAWAWWYIAFNLLVNISQGAVAFILLSFNGNDNGPLFVSILYASFLIVQICATFGLLKRVNSANPFSVIILLISNSILLIILSSLTSPILQLICVLIIGILYGLSIPLLSEVIFSRVRESSFREMLAYGRSVGRLASLVALWLAGIGLAWGIDNRSLLFISGLMLSISSLALGFTAFLLTRQNRGDASPSNPI